MSTTPEKLVQRFYHEVWNNADEHVAKEILAEDFRFRGSLGSEKLGQDGFIEYMLSIHRALADYQCIIEDLITTDSRASARMTFKGKHQAELFGIEATGKEIKWAGAAFFTVKNGRLTELWVLGDIDSIKQQLASSTSS